MEKLKTIVLSLLIQLTSCSIYHLMSQGPFSSYINNAPNYLPTYSINFLYTNNAFICPGNNYLYLMNFNASDSYSFGSYALSGMNSSYQVRTFYYNAVSLKNNTFIIFTSSQIKIYYNNLGSSIIFYTVANISGESVSDVLFSKNSNSQIYLLVKNSTLGNYVLMFYKSSILITKIITQVPTSSNYIEMILQNGNILILFNIGILVHSSSSSLSFIQFISFPVGTTSYSYSAMSTYLLYFYGTNCIITNFTGSSYQLVYTFTAPTTLIDIELSIPFIYMSSATTMYQYDLHLFTVVSTFVTGKNLTGYKSAISLGKQIILTKPYPNTNILYQYQSSNVYIACKISCPNCPLTYFYNSTIGKCIKNTTVPIVFPPLNITSNSTNVTNLTNLTNVTVNGTINVTVNSTINTTANLTINNTYVNTYLNTTNGTVNQTLNQTLNQTVNQTVNQIVNITNNTNINQTNGTANGTVNGTINGTVNEKANGTINETVNTTDNTTLNITVNLTQNQTTDQTINSTLNSTINQTINSTLNQTLNSTMNSTMNQTMNQTINSTSNSTTVNGTNITELNTTNSTYSTNSTVNTTNNSSNTTVNITYPTNITITDNLTNTQTGQANDEEQNQIWTILGMTLTISTMKFNPKFIVSLTMFLDDLYYYQFHRNNYTQSAKFFMDKIDILNVIRLYPTKYFFFAEPLRDDVVGVTPNEKYYILLTFNQNNTDQVHNNPDQVYFANSTENIYKQYILILIFTFGCLKFICYLFYWLSRLNPLFLSPCKYLSNKTRSLCFFSSLLEANLTGIVFSSGIQLILAVRLDYFDSLDLAFCVLALFLTLTYIILFYPLLFLLKQRKKTKFLVIRSKLSQQGVISEGICVYLRMFLRTFVHAVLIQHYEIQISLLIVIDIFSSVATYYFQGGFQGKFIFYCIFMYNVLFALLDILFLVGFQYEAELNHQKYDQTIFVLIVILICIFLLLTLQLLFEDLKTVCQWILSFKIRNNKIHNEGNDQEQNISHSKKKVRSNKSIKKLTFKIKAESEQNIGKQMNQSFMNQTGLFQNKNVQRNLIRTEKKFKNIERATKIQTLELGRLEQKNIVVSIFDQNKVLQIFQIQ